MSDKVPYVKVSVSFYLKDAPKDQLGLRQVTWNFGDDPTSSFDSTAAAFIYRFLEFYIGVMPTPTEELNASLQKLGDYIHVLKVEEKSGE